MRFTESGQQLFFWREEGYIYQSFEQIKCDSCLTVVGAVLQQFHFVKVCSSKIRFVIIGQCHNIFHLKVLTFSPCCISVDILFLTSSLYEVPCSLYEFPAFLLLILAFHMLEASSLEQFSKKDILDGHQREKSLHTEVC